jgi:Zn-dependent protease with chaperone function
LPIQAAYFAHDSVGSLSLVSQNCAAWITGISSFVGAYYWLRHLGNALGFKRTPLWYDLRATLFALHGVLILIAAVFGFWTVGRTIATLTMAHAPAETLVISRHTIPGHVVWQLLPAAAGIALLWGPVQTLLFRTVGLYREDRGLLLSLEPVFRQTGTRPRAVWVVPASSANALAYPLRKTIAITERLLEVLAPEELAAVVAHEIGHLKEGHKARWRLSLLWLVCSASFAFPFIDPDDTWGFAVALFAAFFLLMKLLRVWSRRREHDADNVALTVSKAAVYARALEKLYEVNLFPATQRGGSHPSLYDRLERAGIEPDYPRPELPSRKPTFAGLIAVILFPVVAVAWPHLWQAASGDSAAVSAVVSQRAHPLGRLALEAWDNGDTATAISLYRRAEELDVASPWYPRNLAAVLNQTGDCPGARDAAMRAHARANNDPEILAELFKIECD